MLKDTYEFVKDEEGFRSKPYMDTEDVPTFGIGFTYITEDEANFILKKRLEEIDDQLEYRYWWYHLLSEKRQTVVISMVYQLGLDGFKGFKNTILALEEEDYTTASEEMLDSKWAVQTPARAKRQAQMMKQG